MGKKLNLVGSRFERLFVVKDIGWYYYSGGGRRTYWECLCDCGTTVKVTGNNLRSGNTKSCGCFNLDQHTTHGLSTSRTRNTHFSMIQRCYNPKSPAYPLYGARGVTVCDGWNPRAGGSFENFLKSMGERPEGMSLDRINGELGYSPENCRWADNSLQGFNQRRRSTNTSGRTGVSPLPDGKWHARICVRGEILLLGNYLILEDAIRVREEAELKYFGFIKEE